MKEITSNRAYQIAGFDSGDMFTMNLDLNTLLCSDDDLELIYSLREDVDVVLDLRVGDCFTTFSSRDNRTDLNKMMVLRVK